MTTQHLVDASGSFGMVRNINNTSRTILVADEQPGFRRMIADTLLSAGITVIEVPDGQSLVARAHSDSPDLILVNDALHSPDICSVLHILRAQDQTAGIPIVLLTDTRSNDESEDEADHAAAVADRCLTKPFSPLELVGVIDQFLGRASICP